MNDSSGVVNTERRVDDRHNSIENSSKSRRLVLKESMGCSRRTSHCEQMCKTSDTVEMDVSDVMSVL